MLGFWSCRMYRFIHHDVVSYSAVVLLHGEYEWQDPKSPDEMYA